MRLGREGSKCRENSNNIIYGRPFAVLWALAPPGPTMSRGFFLSGAGHLYFFVYKTYALSQSSDNNAMLTKKFWAIKF